MNEGDCVKIISGEGEGYEGYILLVDNGYLVSIFPEKVDPIWKTEAELAYLDPIKEAYHATNYEGRAALIALVIQYIMKR